MEIRRKKRPRVYYEGVDVANGCGVASCGRGAASLLPQVRPGVGAFGQDGRATGDGDDYDDHGIHHTTNHLASSAGGASNDASLGSGSLGASTSSSLLLEKDDKTLELETQAAIEVKNSILPVQGHAFDVVASAAAIAMDLTEDDRGDGRRKMETVTIAKMKTEGR